MMPRWSAKRHIIFDWNGTLIDDVDLAVNAVNRCGRVYGVPPVTRESYRERFCFPIRDFYSAIGFDLNRHSFADIMNTYLDVFDSSIGNCSLHDGVEQLLVELGMNGYRLSILSACEQGTLLRIVENTGLARHFAHVVGIENRHAASKLERASFLQTLAKVPPQETVYVGDTTHDAEVARAVGWEAILVSCGHQDPSRLRGSTCTVVAGPSALLGRSQRVLGAMHSESGA
jgi:phosphoglycolate phosphatase